MFIHIGNGNVILSDKIIAMMDYRTISSSSENSEGMLAEFEKDKEAIGSKRNAKSVIITTDKVYYTSVAVSTLKKRENMLSAIRNMEDFASESE